MISGRFTFLPDLLMKPWLAMAFSAGQGERAVIPVIVSHWSEMEYYGIELTVVRSRTLILREPHIGGVDLRAMLREQTLQTG